MQGRYAALRKRERPQMGRVLHRGAGSTDGGRETKQETSEGGAEA
jgi:hypothetical protein